MRNDGDLLGQTPRVANLDAAAELNHLTTTHNRRSTPKAHRNGQADHQRSQTHHKVGKAHHNGQGRNDGQGRQDGQVRNDGQGRNDGPVRQDGGQVRQSGRLESSVGDALGAGAVPGAVSGVREIGDQPVRYLRARQQDVLDGKDRAVRQVRDVADEAGVPGVGVPDLLQGRPVIGGLVHRVTEQQSLLNDGATPGVPQGPTAQRGVDRVRDEAAPVASPRARSAAMPFTAVAVGAPAHENVTPCPGCGDDRAPSPGPALPSGQDGPRGGGSAGGHPFAPIADLLNRQYPAAPSGADPGTFRRTALRDVAAPGGPSVVPD
ncbi:hypothetical protein ACFQY7_43570 [Actinomadura luteofluorescens]|uniref:hypothetical protein n=1 Tax=Actinomadura luteofluorescens TaxID=46163 RepID=UPI00363B9FB5